MKNERKKYVTMRETPGMGSRVDEWDHCHPPAAVYHGFLWSSSFPNSFQSVQAGIYISLTFNSRINSCVKLQVH